MKSKIIRLAGSDKSPPVPLRRGIHPASTHRRRLTRSVPLSAPRAEPAKNKLAVANNPLTDRTTSGPGDVVPLHVFNVTAAIADEVVVRHACEIESAGAALNGHFPYQTRFHQVPQIIVGCCPGGPWIHAIHCLEDFRSRGMSLVVLQECHDGVALRSAAQSAALQGPLDGVGVHTVV